MLHDIVQVMLGFASPPLLAGALCRSGRWPAPFYRTWLISALGGGSGAALPPPGWMLVAGSGASALVALVLWWLSRRRRDRARKQMGAKARALIAAMVAKLRESAKPRPVLRPVPGRAG